MDRMDGGCKKFFENVKKSHVGRINRNGTVGSPMEIEHTRLLIPFPALRRALFLNLNGVFPCLFTLGCGSSALSQKASDVDVFH